MDHCAFIGLEDISDGLAEELSGGRRAGGDGRATEDCL